MERSSTPSTHRRIGLLQRPTSSPESLGDYCGPTEFRRPTFAAVAQCVHGGRPSPTASPARRSLPRTPASRPGTAPEGLDDNLALADRCRDGRDVQAATRRRPFKQRALDQGSDPLELDTLRQEGSSPIASRVRGQKGVQSVSSTASPASSSSWMSPSGGSHRSLFAGPVGAALRKQMLASPAGTIKEGNEASPTYESVTSVGTESTESYELGLMPMAPSNTLRKPKFLSEGSLASGAHDDSDDEGDEDGGADDVDEAQVEFDVQFGRNSSKASLPFGADLTEWRRDRVRRELARLHHGSPKEAFKSLDFTGTGRVCMSEFSGGVERLGMNWQQVSGLRMAHQLFRLMDAKKDGVLDFEELFPEDADEVKEETGAVRNVDKDPGTARFWSKWCRGGDDIATAVQMSNGCPRWSAPGLSEKQLELLLDSSRMPEDAASTRSRIRGAMRRLKARGKSDSKCRELLATHLPRGTGPKDRDDVNFFSDYDVEHLRNSYTDEVSTIVTRFQKDIHDLQGQCRAIQHSKYNLKHVVSPKKDVIDTGLGDALKALRSSSKITGVSKKKSLSDEPGKGINLDNLRKSIMQMRPEDDEDSDDTPRPKRRGKSFEKITIPYSADARQTLGLVERRQTLGLRKSMSAGSGADGLEKMSRKSLRPSHV